jgi:3-isopropylmalate dehydrogenase
MPTLVSNNEVAKIVVLPGDGIGPDIARAAERLLDVIGNVVTEEHPIGGCSIDAHGEALTNEVLAHCKDSDGILLAAVGGTKWDGAAPGAPRPEDGLLKLRKELGHGDGLYANLRPVKPYDTLLDSSPLREERIRGTDLLIVRELTGGIYYGDSGLGDPDPSGDPDKRKTFDTCEYTPEEIKRVAAIAFKKAQERGDAQGRRGKLTSVDKANVMKTSQLWRATVNEIASEWPSVDVEHLLVDNAAMQLVSWPSQFDVILTENTFGDILSDAAAMISGSLGMLPSASIDHFPPGLFEPIHGSAPNIAGRGIANPLAMLLSVALLFRHGLGRFPGAQGVADAIEQAVETVLNAGLRTPDLISESGADSVSIHRVGTEGMADAVIEALELPDIPWTENAVPREVWEQQLTEQLQPA